MEDFTLNLIAFDLICCTEHTEDVQRTTENTELFAIKTQRGFFATKTRRH